tara:strand:- start:1368 stop:1580 length:213 start_codon:yes stop_codon:yes gene_type:complete
MKHSDGKAVMRYRACAMIESITAFMRDYGDEPLLAEIRLTNNRQASAWFFAGAVVGACSVIISLTLWVLI